MVALPAYARYLIGIVVFASIALFICPLIPIVLFAQILAVLCWIAVVVLLILLVISLFGLFTGHV